MIKVPCPSCKKEFKVNTIYRRKELKCPYCKFRANIDEFLNNNSFRGHNL